MKYNSAISLKVVQSLMHIRGTCRIMTIAIMFFFFLLIICIYIGSILQEITNTVFDEDNKLSSLMSMGYTRDEASIAMERCGAYFSVMQILKWFSFLFIFVHDHVISCEDLRFSFPHPNYDP